MGFIYKITNNINNKSYIGKTARSIEIRYKEHLRHKDYLDLPLYRALNKYGVENFSVSQVEECDNKDLDNREIYWINFYKTYSDGYNCTAGGEGGIKTYEEDIEAIIARYQAGERLDLLCKEYHHDYSSIRPHLISKGILIDTHAGPKKLAKQVMKLNPVNGECLEVYESISDAARAICPENTSYKNYINGIRRNLNKNSIYHKYLWKTVSKGDDYCD